MLTVFLMVKSSRLLQIQSATKSTIVLNVLMLNSCSPSDVVEELVLDLAEPEADLALVSHPEEIDTALSRLEAPSVLPLIDNGKASRLEAPSVLPLTSWLDIGSLGFLHWTPEVGHEMPKG